MPDVEILVLWSLGWWRAMSFMLPVFVPQAVRIGAGDEKSWDGDV